MSAALIEAEELDWAKECLAAGDTLEDLAEMSGQPVDVWRSAFPGAKERRTVEEGVEALLKPTSLRRLRGGEPPSAPLASRYRRQSRWWTEWSEGLRPFFDLAPATAQPPELVRVSRIAGGMVLDARYREDHAICALSTTLRQTRAGLVVSQKRLTVSFFVPSERLEKA